MGRYDDKTEAPTEQRRRKARREGTVAKSQEIGSAVSLLGLVLLVQTIGSKSFDAARTATERFLGGAGAGLAQPGLGGDASAFALQLGGPFLAATLVLAIVAGVVQTRGRLAPVAAKPKLSNLKLSRGFERLKPSTALWELVRTTAKIALLSAAVAAPLADWPTHVLGARSLPDALSTTGEASRDLLLRVALLAGIVAGADYLWNRRRTEKQLKMSKQELKQEHKDSEGDPLVRSQRRRRALDLSRNRMLSDVADADVLIVNPTHIAIALRYDPAEGAPRVVARGAGHVATKLRAIAYRNGVPVTADKPLARALYRRTKVGQYVPAQLFEAVAVVLAVAYRRRGRGPAGATTATGAAA